MVVGLLATAGQLTWRSAAHQPEENLPGYSALLVNLVVF